MFRKFWDILAFILLGFPAVASEQAPAWLRQAAGTSVPAYGNNVPYVVLQDQARLDVDESGHITKTTTRTIKILLKEGRESAAAQVVYNSDTDKVREFRAWLIQPDGKVKKYDKADTVDAALVSSDLYSDIRRKVISAAREADVGGVFGYEIVLEQRSIFNQCEYMFQSYAPVLISRLTVALPPHWTVECKTFNHSEIKPVTDGSSYVWELRELPYIQAEPSSPSIMNITPRIAVSYFPPPGFSSGGRSFKSWTDVSQWLSELNDPQFISNEEMSHKATDLIAGAHSEFEKIAAIARFVQQINYVSIQMGIGRGGGYRPHTATETFAKAYGDCKDKTNLMRALLKVIGIVAYPVSIFSGY